MDLNVRAFRVVQAAISECKEPTETDAKKAAARKGGMIGGPSRARNMTAARRREIARDASNARWRKRRNESR
jgi:hypothetical protein